MATTYAEQTVAWSGFYYPELKQALLLYKRKVMEDVTSESEYELLIQILDAFAFIGHLNNCHLDVVANDLTIPNVKLLSSLKNLLALIGVKLKGYTPATADVLLTLSQVTTSDLTKLVPQSAGFTTSDEEPIRFEATEDWPLDRTDRLYRVYAQEEEDSGSDGAVDSAVPTRFSAASATFVYTDVDKEVFITNSQSGNNNRYRIARCISTNIVELVRWDGTAPAFTTEGGLDWSLKGFSDDYAEKANTDGQEFTPWTSPAVNDALYVAHRQALWDQIVVEIGATAGADFTGCWEYYDPELGSARPETVTKDGGGGGTIRFKVDGLLARNVAGTAPDRAGAFVRVTYIPTGAWEECVSAYSSPDNYIDTTTYLGQVSPSTDPADYLVTVDWVPLEGQEDGSSAFAQDGAVTYVLPQHADADWQRCAINQVVARWLRFRVCTVSSPTGPALDRVKIDAGGQYALIGTTQGQTTDAENLGASDGSADQTFTLANYPYIDDTVAVEVNESGTLIPWTEVDTRLNSRGNSRHFTVDVEATGEAAIQFGDDTNGRIPPAGGSIYATYRHSADVDGNVGAGTIVVNADSIAFTQSVINPRAAAGWAEKEGGTDAELERLKITGPQRFLTRDRGITKDDIAYLAEEYTKVDGSKPISRARAIPEGSGAKTVDVIAVGPAAGRLSQDDIDEIQTYFNGDESAGVAGVVVLNHEVSVKNYQRKVINVTATVTWKGGSTSGIRAALESYLQPLSLEDDGVNYVWPWSGFRLVALSKLIALIHQVDVGIRRVEMTVPSADTPLGEYELPYPGTITISIIEPEE